jgi:hypothetical protein
MRKFAELVPDEEILQTVSAVLSWSHNTYLFDKIKTLNEYLGKIYIVKNKGLKLMTFTQIRIDADSYLTELWSILSGTKLYDSK